MFDLSEQSCKQPFVSLLKTIPCLCTCLLNLPPSQSKKRQGQDPRFNSAVHIWRPLRMDAMPSQLCPQSRECCPTFATEEMQLCVCRTSCNVQVFQALQAQVHCPSSRELVIGGNLGNTYLVCWLDLVYLTLVRIT